MSSNFIPMLSSSPPPIDDTESPENDDDDDAFGMFATADHGFDCSFDNVGVSENISFENSSPQHCNTNLDNNSPQYAKENHIKHSIQVNCSFKPAGIPVFSIDKRSEQKSIPILKCENNFRTDFHSGLEDNDLKSEISKSPVTYFSHTLKQNFSNHSSFEDHAEICISECNHDGTSSHEFVPSSCNTVVPETSPKSKTVEPDSVLNNDTPTVDFANCKDSVHARNLEFSQCDNHLDDDDGMSESVEFCNFESVNISEHVNGESEPQPFESEVLLSASNNACKSDINLIGATVFGTNCDIVSENIAVLDSEKTNSYPIIEDHASLERVDPPDKIPSLSSSRCSEDFDDFKFSNTLDDDTDAPVESVLAKAMSSTDSVESDENFGDFASVNVASSSALADSVCVGCKPSDDFADFKSSELCDEQSWQAVEADFKSAETEDFADFEEASSKTDLHVPLTETVISKGSSGGLEKITKVICAVFPLSKEAELNEEGEIIFDTLEQNSKSRRLWDKLHDNDQTPGIPFQWGVSHSFQQLLRSVNVDYHSILRTSTVPFFASGLGLLEPTKGPGTKDSNNTNCSDSDMGGSKDPIPPVHFDWGSSGLVNPLDSGQVSSTLMDLSFLTSSESSSCSEKLSKDFNLENELLRPDPEILRSIPSANAPILEHILSLSANSSVLMTESISRSRPLNLSEEAIHVLDQLPDISYVRAKVLMFPISDNT